MTELTHDIIMHSTEDVDGLPAYYDRTGERISMMRAMELRSDIAYKILRTTKVGRRAVITSWLGEVQRNMPNDGAPYIYGTIVQKGKKFDHGVEVFANSEESALSDHERLVARLRAPRLRHR